MCGRYASARSVEDLASTFGIMADDVDALPAPDWNIAPTKPVPAVLHREDHRVLTTLRWGLVPGWSDGADLTGRGATLFNARIETAADKPAFRDAVERRRCLLPADGWYEWMRRGDGRRVPHFLSAADGSVLALAAIWETWYDGDGRPVRSTAIVTRAAPDQLRDIHDRSPVVLPSSAWEAWLDPATPAAAALAIAGDAVVEVRTWPVGDRVGDVRESGSALADPVSVDEQTALF